MVSPNGSIWSKTFLSRSLVKIVSNITWCTRSTVVLACGFLVFVKAGLISKSFIKGLKYGLNPDPLSRTTLCGCRYLHIRAFLNNWLTLADDLSMYSSLPAVTSSRSNVGT